MKLPNYWKVKPIRVHFGLDTDRDGVLDFKDCQPFNYWKQDTITPREERMLKKVNEMYDKIDDYAKQHPDVDFTDSGYDITHPHDVDPLVQPVVDEIYKKGLSTACSCQGGRRGSGHSAIPSIDIERNDKLILAFYRAGFFPTPHSSRLGYVSMECPDFKLSDKKRKELWQKALKEVKKI